MSSTILSHLFESSPPTILQILYSENVQTSWIFFSFEGATDLIVSLKYSLAPNIEKSTKYLASYQLF
ncbi:hypothetical protein CAEBREN_29822 [Caenorhabditis brenneri]|uniref:Uncharacterized protein n=1 Tax=Caenorhabditis brenneri TaxID=135651 RepID=G0PFF7_CAEBE|nr:hypothetical protein CAEBREN_29822 [Caenorhabditis brenneri]